MPDFPQPLGASPGPWSASRIAAIRRKLAEVGDGVLRDRAWLQDSLADPQGFAAALFASAGAAGESPIKSQLGIAYDLYHDAVARHARGPAAERPCFTYSTPRLGGEAEASLATISYAHLHAAATVLSASWRKRGVLAGDRIAIIYAMGPELLLALCAALRLGLLIAVLPPLGPDFLAHRLNALRPRHIVTARRYQPLLREWYGEHEVPLQDALLEEARLAPEMLAATLAAAIEVESSASEAPGSQAYGPSDVAFAVYSEQRTPSWTPLPVAASASYLGALCDGLLLGLAPGGGVVAAPLHHQLTFQPTLLFLSLLHGATYLQVDTTALSVEPERPQARLPGIDVLLVSAALRDELLQRTPALPALASVGLWVTALTEGEDAVAWGDFIAHCGLSSAPALSWHYDAAAGGCQLFSLRQRGVVPQIVHPSPGRPFLLTDPSAESEPARGPNGILRPVPGSCGLLLYGHAGGYLYGGTRWPTASGRSLSVAEVELCVATLPYVAGAVVVPTPGDKSAATLLTFVGPHLKHLGNRSLLELEHRIREQIRTRLGVDFVPSRVRILAALPRRTEQGIDVNWCAQQLREGGLERRALDPALHLIDRLIFACHRVSTPAGFMTLRAQYKR